MVFRLDGDDLDERWRSGLRASAPYVDVSRAPIRVHGRLTRRRQRRRFVTSVAIATLIIAGTGLVFALTRTDRSTTLRTAGGPPSPAAVTVVHVASEPTLRLSLDRTVVPSGLIRIDYATHGGTHVLRIQGIPAERFALRVPGGRTSEVLRLHRGHYVLYCAIPGHRAAGEEAVLTVE